MRQRKERRIYSSPRIDIKRERKDFGMAFSTQDFGAVHFLMSSRRSRRSMK